MINRYFEAIYASIIVNYYIFFKDLFIAFSTENLSLIC